MKKETVQPLPQEILLKVEEVQAGLLDTSSRKSAIECAEVLAVGEGVTDIKKGDKVLFKSWAVDIVTHNNKEYHFINLNTKGVKAIIK